MENGKNASLADDILSNINSEYEKIVKEALKNDFDCDIPNSTLDHAVILSQGLLKASQKDIKILTGELNSPYYTRVRDSLVEATDRVAKRRGKIRILIWNEVSQKNDEFEKLLAKYKGVIEKKEAKKPNSDLINHFFVSDSKRYRIENPHTQEELRERKVCGKGNFNNPAKAKILDEIFEKLWQTT